MHLHCCHFHLHINTVRALLQINDLLNTVQVQIYFMLNLEQLSNELWAESTLYVSCKVDSSSKVLEKAATSKKKCFE